MNVDVSYFIGGILFTLLIAFLIALDSLLIVTLWDGFVVPSTGFKPINFWTGLGFIGFVAALNPIRILSSFLGKS